MVGLLLSFVVHLHSEHLAEALVCCGVSRHENHLLTLVDHTLLDTASQHISHTLDLVDTGQRHPHRSVPVAAWRLCQIVQAVVQGIDVDLAIRRHDITALPPVHVAGLLVQVVTHPAGDRQHRNALLNEVLLPAHLDKHVLHLTTDLVVASLCVRTSGVSVHLVHTHEQLLHAQQVDETSVLAGLTLHLSSLVVALLDCSGEVTISRNHEQAHISLSSARDHVLDEIPVSRSIDDCEVPLLSEEVLGGASNGHTTLALLLLAVHEESESKGLLAKGLSLSLELLHGTLIDTTQLKQQTASGSGLAGVHMTTDHNRKVRLATGNIIVGHVECVSQVSQSPC